MEAVRRLSLILSCTTLFFLCCNSQNAAPLPKIDAIYQFGDSVSDTGNTKIMDPKGSCSQPPYGQTYFKEPTGRCCDGLLIVDQIAKALNLPFLNPYLAKSSNFTNGVNFAVAGATCLDLAVLRSRKITAVGNPDTLPVQLDWFKKHLATICKNPTECKAKLENSLFIVGTMGGNDYNSAMLSGQNKPEQLQKLTTDIAQMLLSVTKELIGLGAKRIIVPGTFYAGGLESQLQAGITTLQKENPGVKVVYGDYAGGLSSIVNNAAALGFDKSVLMTGCCAACGSPGSKACPEPSRRVSWDGLHFTQHAYQIVADHVLDQIRKM